MKRSGIFYKSLFSFATTLLVLSAAFTSPASAQELVTYDKMPAGDYRIDTRHAFILWKVSHAGLSTYVGRFKEFDSTLHLDPKDVTKSRVTATINPASLETDYVPGERDFNKELSTKEEWFNSAKFPQITFQSTRLVKTGDNTGKLHGDLTLLGVTKPVTLDVTFNGGYPEQPFSKKPTLGFAATGKITRSDWGLDTYTPMIGDEVELEIHAEFFQEAKQEAKKGA